MTPPGLTATLDPNLYAVELTVTVPAGADRLDLYRVGPSGTRAYVRGYHPGEVTAGQVLTIRDFEAPIGVSLTYTAVAYADATPGDTGTASVMLSIPSQGCDDTWITDLARPTNTQRVVLESLEELDHEVPAGVHSVLVRRDPIVSSDVARTPTFELLFLTEDDQDRERAKAILGNGLPVLLRTPPENGIGNMYMSVTNFIEQRLFQLATNQERRFVVEAVQVRRPDPGIYVPEPPATYATVKSTYATYADFMAAYETYDAALYDYGTGAPVFVVAWPPADV